MQRLISLEKQLASGSSLDNHEFKLVVFGPNYPEREKGFETLRNNDMLKHYHLTEDSKEQIRYKTLQNVIKARKTYHRSYEDVDADPNPTSLYANAFVFYDLGFSVRSGVHYYLYSKAISLLGTEKHKDLLLRAYDLKDIGCFGLTELAHGSNVKGILTEAHYDHQNQQFVMHSPSKEGTRFSIQP